MLLVDGVPQTVQVAPQGDNRGVSISGDGWDMDLDGLGPDGRPLNLGPEGVLRLQSEREVQTTGSGFQSNSQVDLFMDPPTSKSSASTQTWWSRAVTRSTGGIFVGTVTVNAQGEFSGVATLPDDVAPGGHVIQAVGSSVTGQTRAMNLGVQVDPSITLVKGKRESDGRHDRIRATGTSAGLDEGTLLTPWIRYTGQSSFTKGKTAIMVRSDGTFRWTRQIKKSRGITVYMAWKDVHSNKVTWMKVR